MNPRTRRSSLAANPVLIGAATVLIAIVAVVLAYNANSGLPFVKTYNIQAQIPDAAGLIVGNDVRKGGARIGFVSAIHPRVERNGSVGATIDMKLDEVAKPLPVDSRIAIRPRSPLGLRYAELTAGKSKTMLKSGQTISLQAAADKPVELDDFFNTFDTPTRDASQQNLLEFGDGVAGQGANLNRAFKDLGPLVQHLEPAARNLVAPGTGFDKLFPALARAAAEVAPVADQQASLFTGLNQTFTALANVRGDLQDTIAYGPAALQAGIDEFPKQAKFTRDSTELFKRLRPAFASLSSAAPSLASAVTKGKTALRRAPQLNKRVVTTLDAVDTFGNDPRVLNGLRDVGTTAGILGTTVDFITPAQTKCNYITLLLRNLASVTSDSTSLGSSVRTGVVIEPQGPNSEAGPAAAPANSAGVQPAPPLLPTTADSDNHLHSNPYPNTAAPGQTQECEAGNEPFAANKTVIGNVPGDQGLVTESNEGFGVTLKPVKQP